MKTFIDEQHQTPEGVILLLLLSAKADSKAKLMMEK